MREIRIYTDQSLTPGSVLELPAQTVTHIVRVLRLPVGANLTLFNGDGYDYLAELTVVAKQDAQAHVIRKGNEEPFPPLDLTLAQSIARGDKMDWILQKATELGVSRIVPILSERSEVKLSGERAQRRLAHWRGVIIGACEQSGRARLPELESIQALDRWLSLLPESSTTRLVLSPHGQVRPRDLAAPDHEIVIAAGPEGGYSERDLALFRQTGFRELRLGSRILRTETAGLAALSALQAILGDL